MTSPMAQVRQCSLCFLILRSIPSHGKIVDINIILWSHFTVMIPFLIGLFDAVAILVANMEDGGTAVWKKRIATCGECEEVEGS